MSTHRSGTPRKPLLDRSLNRHDLTFHTGYQSPPCLLHDFLCSLLIRATDGPLRLSSLADFSPLCLHSYPTCLLCRKLSCCLCTQNIYLGVTNSPIAKYSCRNESLPSLVCMYYHCKQQHCPEPLNRRLLVICY